MTLLIFGAVASETQMIPNATTLGVGLVRTAAQLGQLLSQKAYTQILFTGTCGALTLPIGSIIRARAIILGDLSTLSGDSFMPDILPTTITPTRFLNSDTTIIESDVFCPLSITKSDHGAVLLKKKFPQGVVENLECFAVAAAAAERKIPCEIILGVSNVIGPSGHQEWLTHHQEVSRATMEWILKQI